MLLKPQISFQCMGNPLGSNIKMKVHRVWVIKHKEEANIHKTALCTHPEWWYRSHLSKIIGSPEELSFSGSFQQFLHSKCEIHRFFRLGGSAQFLSDSRVAKALAGHNEAGLWEENSSFNNEEECSHSFSVWQLKAKCVTERCSALTPLHTPA